MASTPPLLNLPPELQIAVADLLDSDDLLSLRLAHIELATNTFDVFACRFFSKRRHVLTNHSLNALRDITAVPELVRHIKSIELIAIGTDLEYDEYGNMPGAYPPEAGQAPPWCREVDDAYGWQNTGVMCDIFGNLAAVPRPRSLAIDGCTYRCSGYLEWMQRLFNTIAEEPVSDPGLFLYPLYIEESVLLSFGLATYMRKLQPWKGIGNLTSKSPLNIAEVILKALFKSSWRPESLAMAIHTYDTEGTIRYGTDYHDTWISELSSEERAGLKAVCGDLSSFDIDIDYAEALSPTVSGLLAEMRNVHELKISSCREGALEAMGHCVLRIMGLIWEPQDHPGEFSIAINGSDCCELMGLENIKKALAQYCAEEHDYFD
ncbi:hypothetical protein PRZ48_007868 [Zasmidium cellare]|uniref:F-box domain-containing protein n=1 Tax=Zasmidium cellare TaxID=395010 RepID=A0ABR0EKM7_ZASCE|nr:hypothetical protein PRZ48_007868 [Zasmidium cellare]